MSGSQQIRVRLPYVFDILNMQRNGKRREKSLISVRISLTTSTQTREVF